MGWLAATGVMQAKQSRCNTVQARTCQEASQIIVRIRNTFAPSGCVHAAVLAVSQLAGARQAMFTL
jgi:formate dehydrogenase assembly factor FdhD